MKETVSVFMDESGKNKNEISLIGSVVVPNNFYCSKSVMELNDKLKREEISFHLTDYKKSQLKDYLNLFDLFVSNENSRAINLWIIERVQFIY